MQPLSFLANWKGSKSFLADARPGRCPCFASHMYKMSAGGKMPSVHWSIPVTILKKEMIHYYLPSWCSVFSMCLLYGWMSKWIIIFLIPDSVTNWRAVLCTNSINICWLSGWVGECQSEASEERRHISTLMNWDEADELVCFKAWAFIPDTSMLCPSDLRE